MDYTGKLLVAMPQLNDPIFASSVVLIYEDTKVGTAGLVLNKPSNFSLVELARLNNYEYLGPEMLYKGGPVNDQAIIMLHSDEWYCESTMQFGQGLAITSDKMMLEKVVTGNSPDYFRIFSGVSAWQKGQLNFEIKRKSWMITDWNIDVVFGTDKQHQYQSAINLCSRDAFSSFFG